MKIIALEEHYVPRRVSDAWTATAATQDFTVAMNGNQYAKQLEDMEDARIQAMDDAGIDVQVLSLPSPGVQNFEPTDAVEVARDFNDILTGVIASRPDRFDGFATLPAPAPQAAAKELQRAVQELGLKGALLNGRVRERNLEHRDFEPIYEAAEALRAPLYLHPQLPPTSVREAYYTGIGPVADLMLSMGAIGWHYETGIQLLRMVLGGVFDRYPTLQVIVGHWGEVVLFYLDRIAQLNHAGLKLERPIADYFQQNVYYTPSGIFSQRYLSRTLELVGVDRMMFSQDWPYQSSRNNGARAFLEQAALSKEEKEAIAHGNWERLISSIQRGPIADPSLPGNRHG
jgi:predicted TIM-barrel fold metal-dependent hydrolase